MDQPKPKILVVDDERSNLELLERILRRRFDHDCREGICGTCSLTINGLPHGAGARPAATPR